jgi:wobble nucleotide-excising tRNase
MKFQAGGFTYQIDEFLSIPANEEAAVLIRIQKLEQDIKSKESEATVRKLVFPHELVTPSFNLLEIKELATKNIGTVHEAAKKCVLDHIEHNIKDKEKSHAQTFIRQGLELMQADCPFCGQDIQNASDLIQAYRAFFDETFRTYLTDLKSKIDAFAKWNIENLLTQLISIHNANIAIAKQWEPFIVSQPLPDVAAFIEGTRGKLNNIKALMQIELGKKQKDPNIDIDISPFNGMMAELDLLKKFIEIYNKAVAIFTEAAKTYLANLLKLDIDGIRQRLAREHEIEKRFKPEWKKWVTKYLATKKDVDDLRTKKDAKQTELEDYTKSIFNMYQTRINQLLLTLGTDFQITNLTGKTDDRANESYSDFGFLILEQIVPLTTRQDDSPCFKNTLSEGDKTTLAFAFFIAALEKLPDLDKQIVVLDDPLSSLDETRREATARILLDLSPKVNQLCVFTHKRDFLFMLCDKLPSHTVLQIRSDKKNGSRLEQFDIEEDRKGEHAKMIDEMQRYINEDFGPTPDMMQGNIRKIFEIVLKTKYYRTLVAHIKEKQGFSKLLKSLFDAGLLPLGIKTKLFDLCNLTNDVHHGNIIDVPSKKLTRDELIPLIRDALELLEKI